MRRWQTPQLRRGAAHCGRALISRTGGPSDALSLDDPASPELAPSEAPIGNRDAALAMGLKRVIAAGHPGVAPWSADTASIGAIEHHKFLPATVFFRRWRRRAHRAARHSAPRTQAVVSQSLEGSKRAASCSPPKRPQVTHQPGIPRAGRRLAWVPFEWWLGPPVRGVQKLPAQSVIGRWRRGEVLWLTLQHGRLLVRLCNPSGRFTRFDLAR